ncbi:hypothetical protein E2542_SST21777 [Spatholobus suberectus]|nr:hypothetical protein E2542_SST21777 [Spatholobus suberectus]
MAGGQFHTLLHATSRSSLVKPSSSKPFFNNTIKNYGQASNGNRSRLMEERAPSTAEEFQRVAEEKAREAKESQNVGKSCDGAQEGTIGDSKAESVKSRSVTWFSKSEVVDVVTRREKLLCGAAQGKGVEVLCRARELTAAASPPSMTEGTFASQKQKEKRRGNWG